MRWAVNPGAAFCRDKQNDILHAVAKNTNHNLLISTLFFIYPNKAIAGQLGLLAPDFGGGVSGALPPVSVLSPPSK